MQGRTVEGSLGALRGSLPRLEARTRAIALTACLLFTGQLVSGAASTARAQDLPEPGPTPGELAQGQKSYWQSLVVNLTWTEVDSLRNVVQEFKDKGAIANYDFLVRDRGKDYEVLVRAEIVDVARWAALRSFRPPARSDPGSLEGRNALHEARFRERAAHDQPRASGSELLDVRRRPLKPRR